MGSICAAAAAPVMPVERHDGTARHVTSRQGVSMNRRGVEVRVCQYSMGVSVGGGGQYSMGVSACVLEGG